MEKVTIVIYCNNAAFCDPDSSSDTCPSNAVARNAQVAAILRDLAENVEAGSEDRILMDANGNHVGEYKLVREI